MSIKFHEDESSTNVIGDTVQLIIERKDKTVTESVITLSPNAVFDIENSTERANLHVDENELQIEWQAEETMLLSVSVTIIKEGDVTVASSYIINDEIYDSNIINLPVEQIVDNSDDTHNEPSNETELEAQAGVETETESEPELETELEAEEESNPAEELTEDIPTKEDEHLVEEEETEIPSKTTTAHSQAIDVNDSVLVGSGKEFRAALEDPTVKKIVIEKKFSVTLPHINMEGDKIIDGNGNTVNFHGYRINIGQHHLIVDNLTIEAYQVNVPKSSIFISDLENAKLTLKNTSYAKVEHAQVAKMEHGHIYVVGTVHFETSGPFEVFEAKNITFEENTDFTGITTEPSGARKEVINLYNSPTVTIGKNASVRLETKGRKSVLQVDDNTQATINVLEGAKLEVYAANITTSNGEPLINLPNPDSRIQLAQGSTLDILNHREGKGLGGLLHVNGSLSMTDNVSRVALWDKGGNENNTFGDKYRYFPEIYDGKLPLQNKYISEGSATEESSDSISDNPAKTGLTFQAVFEYRNTEEIKRLLISPVAVKSVLELEVPDRLNFQPTELGYEEIVIPRENQAWAMRVKDTRRQSHAWEIIAQAEAPLTTRRGHKLDEDALVFVKNNQEYSLKEAVLIQDGVTGSSPETLIEWQATEGILLKINPMSTKIVTGMEYKTNIIWTIQDAP